MDFRDFCRTEVEFFTKALRKNVPIFTNRGTPLSRIDLGFDSLGERFQSILEDGSALNDLSSTYRGVHPNVVIDNTAGQSPVQKRALNQKTEKQPEFTFALSSLKHEAAKKDSGEEEHIVKEDAQANVRLIKSTWNLIDRTMSKRIWKAIGKTPQMCLLIPS